jgi:hypothetical protein
MDSVLEISPLSTNLRSRTLPHDEPLSAPLPPRRGSIIHSSRLSEPAHECAEDEDVTIGSFRHDLYNETILRSIPPARHTPSSRAASISHPPSYAVEITRPTLMFAIASDNVEQVKQVLESGDVNPNEAVGPQSALAFTLTNDKLTNKLEIVKALLAYGADPASAERIDVPALEGTTKGETTAKESNEKPVVVEDLDHATRLGVIDTWWYIRHANPILGTTLNAQMPCIQKEVLLSSNVHFFDH